jgi:hypothetical protein
MKSSDVKMDTAGKSSKNAAKYVLQKLISTFFTIFTVGQSDELVSFCTILRTSPSEQQARMPVNVHFARQDLPQCLIYVQIKI